MSDSSADWLGKIGSDTDSDDAARTAHSSIGPVRTGATYEYGLDGCSLLRLLTDNAKGLSFQIWPSALHLADFARDLDRRATGFWQGKYVVELGSGCGLVGLVLACLGAHVLLTDLPHVLGIIRQNISDNRPAWAANGGTAEAAELSWGLTDVRKMGAPWAEPAYVIAADVIYDRTLFQPLLNTLNAYGPSTEILLAHVRRWTSDRRFFRMLRSARFAVKDATSSEGSTEHNMGIAADQAGVSGARQNGGSLHERGACRIFRIHRTHSAPGDSKTADKCSEAMKVKHH